MARDLNELLADPSKKMNGDELALLSSVFRKEMWDILHQRGTGHWGGSASSAELITALYFNRLNIDPKNPNKDDRDKFILSKGHASVNLYTVLANRGFFSTKDLPTFRKLGSYLQGHPCMSKIPGVDMSTGALGHGISIGLGMALSAQLLDNGSSTYVMTGEGCLNEGQSWEALMMAGKYKPKNFILMIDYNKVQLDGTMDEIMPLNHLRERLSSFGWNVNSTAYDGNNSKDILSSFDWIDSDDVWPKAVIYDTIKGKGVSFTEGKNTWHGKVIDDDSYAKGIIELDKDIKNKGADVWA
jgi:transketolase